MNNTFIPKRHFIRWYWHFLKSCIAALYYGFPAKNLKIIAITGTDGKTTSVGMVTHILRQAGFSVGALSTAFIQINVDIYVNPSEKTSPNPFIIQKFLADLVKKKCTHAVLEASSHGLYQSRLAFTWPLIAGITNIGFEHLDYHKTMEIYMTDKGRLFKKLRRNGLAVLNKNDATYNVYKTYRLPAIKTYAVHTTDADLIADSIKTNNVGTHCKIEDTHSHMHYELQLPIVGAYNIENALLAISIASYFFIDVQTSITSLGSFKNAVGRMEKIDVGQDFSVYIDFTVTPQAFEKTLQALRDMISPVHKVLVLTGSCGERMKEKRPLIGAICSNLANTVVITDDEPYSEDPASIRADIWAGINTTTCDAYNIADREEAITHILKLAQPGDVVLLAGLGSYPIRVMNEGKIPWNEQEITKKILTQLRHA